MSNPHKNCKGRGSPRVCTDHTQTPRSQREKGLLPERDKQQRWVGCLDWTAAAAAAAAVAAAAAGFSARVAFNEERVSLC